MIYPNNCQNEAQKLSYLYKLKQVFIDWHNARGVGTDTNAKSKLKKIHTELNNTIEEAITTNHHKVKALDYTGLVNFPDNFNMANEGSRLSFLFALGDKIRDLPENEIEDYRAELALAKQDAIHGNFWQPKIEDIDG